MEWNRCENVILSWGVLLVSMDVFFRDVSRIVMQIVKERVETNDDYEMKITMWLFNNVFCKNMYRDIWGNVKL